MFKAYEIFDTLLSLSSRDPTVSELLGSAPDTKKKAMLHEKLCSLPFNTLFLEVPLLGGVGFDLHICHNAADIRRQAPYDDDDLYGGYEPLFSWYAAADRGGDGIDMVYDLRDGWDNKPMAYLQMSGGSPDFAGFFRMTSDAGAADRYFAIQERLPEGWRTWYTGVHTRRRGNPLRLGNFLRSDTKKRYAEDMRLLDKDLRTIGFPASLSPIMTDKLKELFAFPVPIDVQLDVFADGTVGDTLGISLGTGHIGPGAMAASLAGGFARDIMELLESWGVADSRRHLLAKTMFALSRMLRFADGDKQRFILSSKIAFFKVRFKGNMPLAYDAKAYIELTAVRA